MRKSQIERMNNINKLMELIGKLDRGFFKTCNGLDMFIERKTTVKYLNGYTQKKLTIPNNDWKEIKGFSHGGTLTALVKDFKEFIITGKKTDGKNGYGGLYCRAWGYSIKNMDKIIKYAKEIGYLRSDSESYSDYMIRFYNKNKEWLWDYQKEEIEEIIKERNNEEFFM
ncbi:MAG: hypothetical protein KHZ90_08210 [Veillonella parvula]|uniref:Uncharacterized protein n=1 Tax=Veillonella parvula TaxID=29466 RepID=A0A942WQT9_VEIPA|nr:hypothetical protein [Veillonella parvula]MBS4893743.1 hypothetical protein [Veillonella parvula]